MHDSGTSRCAAADKIAEEADEKHSKFDWPLVAPNWDISVSYACIRVSVRVR